MKKLDVEKRFKTQMVENTIRYYASCIIDMGECCDENYDIFLQAKIRKTIGTSIVMVLGEKRFKITANYHYHCYEMKILNILRGDDFFIFVFKGEDNSNHTLLYDGCFEEWVHKHIHNYWETGNESQ